MQLDGLMAHQQDGARWLVDNPRGMLAWEMGVGKSATAVRAWENTAERGPLLVLSQASARENWRREIERFAIDPDFPPLVQVIKSQHDRLAPHVSAVVVNYDKLLNPHVIGQLRGRRWGAIVLDEAHVLKSPGDSCQRTRAVYGAKKLRPNQTPLVRLAERVWPLTGTPMPNHPAELWTHAYYLWPESIVYAGVPMDLATFELGFCQIVAGDYGRKIVGGKNLGELKRRVSPHINRLKRKDVLKNLPPCRVTSWPLDMEITSGVRYPDLPELRHELDARFGNPQEVEKFDNATLDVYLACIESNYDSLATIRKTTGTLKAIACALLVREELEQGAPKTVVFAHHREAIEVLQKGLRAFNPAVVHGGVPAGLRRDQEIDRFQNDPACRVFIGQLQAAGASINLQAAQNVVFAEASWTPGENEQALSRVYRHGQTAPVLVRFTYLKGSIDEQISRALARKSAMISQVID